MLIQLNIDDNQSDFFLHLIRQFKSDIIKKVTIIEPKSHKEKSFRDMTDEEKWEAYGALDAKSEKQMELSQHQYVFEQLEKEYGSEEYDKWKK